MVTHGLSPCGFSGLTAGIEDREVEVDLIDQQDSDKVAHLSIGVEAESRKETMAVVIGRDDVTG